VRELVYRQLGKQAEADKDRDQAMQIQPRDARSWNARGEARLRISPADPEGALEDFRQASLTSPSLRNSYENMAHVLSEYLNRPTEAIAALDDAIECDSNYALAWSSRSVLHARVGNGEAAVSDAQQALRLERSAIVCYQAASAYAIVRRDVKDELFALSLLKETVRQNPALAEMMKNDKDLIAIRDQKTLKQIISAASQLK
jgi:tetratricopeptide (TPR) repeat protein